MKKAIILGMILFSFIINSAFASAFVYDDFSGSSLDLTKWSESTNIQFTDEHGVNTTERTYHIAQCIAGDRNTQLIITREFHAGETLEYEVIYHSGEGNQQTQLLIDGSLFSYAYEGVCTTPSPGCGGIGHWNGDTDVGTQKGRYKRTLQFFDNYILMNTTRPDNTSISHKIISVTAPYNIGFATHTGHNGIMHFDYDNFIINGNITSLPSEPTCNLKEFKKWTFDNDMEGWITPPENTNEPVRYCAWENYSGGGYVGNPPGSILCVSCLTSVPSDEFCTYSGCSEFHINIKLPETTKLLTFETSGSWPMYGVNDNYDGGLTFKIKDETGTWHVLYDDCLAIDSSTWLSKSVDISSFAGQNVTLRFEQSEKNCGSGQVCNVEVRRIDNVAILEEVPSCNCTELTEKISELNSTVEDLKNRVKTLEESKNTVPPHTHSISDIIGLQVILGSMQDSLNRIIDFLTYLPRGLRQDMICDYMKTTNTKSLDALGLHCEFKKACNCKPI